MRVRPPSPWGTASHARRTRRARAYAREEARRGRKNGGGIDVGLKALVAGRRRRSGFLRTRDERATHAHARGREFLKTKKPPPKRRRRIGKGKQADYNKSQNGRTQFDLQGWILRGGTGSKEEEVCAKPSSRRQIQGGFPRRRGYRRRSQALSRSPQSQLCRRSGRGRGGTRHWR